jgi:hypothetical protein
MYHLFQYDDMNKYLLGISLTVSSDHNGEKEALRVRFVTPINCRHFTGLGYHVNL